MRPCSAGNSSPEWIKLFQCIADLGFGEPVSVLPRRPPRFHDNLRRTEQDAKLIDDGFDVSAAGKTRTVWDWRPL